MATVVNNPDSGSGGAGGWIIAAVLIVVIALVAIFVWPGYGREAAAPSQINIEVPAPEVTIPTPSTGGGDTAPAQ